MRSIADLLNMVVKEGDLGIEIEVEGANLPKPTKSWLTTEDGSLRGESCEYVLKKPLSKEDAFKALDYLEELYKSNGTVVEDSVRAGIHVHVNIQQLSFTQLFNFITLFTVLEKPLLKFCGESREGNLFCLRASDAEYLVDALSKSAFRKDLHLLYTDDLRYAAMNTKAICQYGSLEFRCLRGTRDFQVVKDWCNILLNLREAAKEYNSPVDIVQALSIEGVNNFCNNVLKDYAHVVLEHEGLEGMLYQGVRLIQDVAYSTEWEEKPERKIGNLWFPDNNVWFEEPLEDY